MTKPSQSKRRAADLIRPKGGAVVSGPSDPEFDAFCARVDATPADELQRQFRHWPTENLRRYLGERHFAYLLRRVDPVAAAEEEKARS